MQAIVWERGNLGIEPELKKCKKADPDPDITCGGYEDLLRVAEKFSWADDVMLWDFAKEQIKKHEALHGSTLVTHDRCMLSFL